MNVAALRAHLAAFPDDMPVVATDLHGVGFDDVGQPVRIRLAEGRRHRSTAPYVREELALAVGARCTPLDAVFLPIFRGA